VINKITGGGSAKPGIATAPHTRQGKKLVQKWMDVHRWTFCRHVYHTNSRGSTILFRLGSLTTITISTQRNILTVFISLVVRRQELLVWRFATISSMYASWPRLADR
jgi:hypothetical protein